MCIFLFTNASSRKGDESTLALRPLLPRARACVVEQLKMRCKASKSCGRALFSRPIARSEGGQRRRRLAERAGSASEACSFLEANCCCLSHHSRGQTLGWSKRRSVMPQVKCEQQFRDLEDGSVCRSTGRSSGTGTVDPFMQELAACAIALALQPVATNRTLCALLGRPRLQDDSMKA